LVGLFTYCNHYRELFWYINWERQVKLQFAKNISESEFADI